ncbi:MAG TPA: KH domain-containing protein [Myxococcota bacterium]|nr:KH domain-containing protein [Myxococcota bacterium]HRY93841.1 KH domain-containing protein [Myxococcota bacterium]
MAVPELVGLMARLLVREPQAVEVDDADDGRDRVITLRVGAADRGRVIGKEGRTAKALRSILAIASAREGRKAKLDIVD